MHACIDTEIPEASINPAVSQHWGGGQRWVSQPRACSAPPVNSSASVWRWPPSHPGQTCNPSPVKPAESGSPSYFSRLEPTRSMYQTGHLRSSSSEFWIGLIHGSGFMHGKALVHKPLMASSKDDPLSRLFSSALDHWLSRWLYHGNKKKNASWRRGGGGGVLTSKMASPSFILMAPLL